LDHINLWILDDGDGFTLVDTGYGIPATWELWEKHFAGILAGKPVKNIVVTHYHPDHVGSAAWLVERTGAPMWMTATEYLSAHAAHDDGAGFDRDNTIELYIANGVAPGSIPDTVRKGGGYSRGVPSVPKRYRRMMHGDKLPIGGRDWEVITVFGHAPEQATLWCESLNVLISGDQVLPRITSNVGVWGSQPESNPLKQFLDSLGRLGHLPGDARVLLPWAAPSHRPAARAPRPAPRAPRRRRGQAHHRFRGAAAPLQAQARRPPDDVRDGRVHRAPALPAGAGPRHARGGRGRRAPLCAALVLLPDERVRGALARHGLRNLVAQHRKVQTREEILATAHEDGTHGKVKLVDEARFEILAHGGHASANAHVAGTRGLLRPIERLVDPARHEMERGPALHLEGLPRMVGEDECRDVVRLLLAPPAFPALVGPGAAHGAEHVASQDPRAEVLESQLRHVVVDAGVPAGLAVHLPPEPQWEEPLHEFRAAHAERILQVLGRPGGVSVEGNGEAAAEDFRHG